MNEKDYQSINSATSQEDSFYRTGSTRPKKSKSGLIAVLLAAVIFLGGIASLLGILNIRLFFQKNPGENPFVRFSSDETTPSSTQDASAPTQDEDSHLNLSDTPESVENVPQEGGLSLQEIYLKSISSVVSISCTLPNGASTGTGVVFSADGYIITNYHVVAEATEISVLFTDETVLSATLVGKDDLTDLAILSVQATDLTPADFGDSTALRVGDAVVAIGDPLGVELRGTMTNGIVSAINRDVSADGRTMTLIQTNAALNSGNSGGPLINCYGQVVGINTMKIGDYMSEAGVEGLGFAIPSATVKQIVDQLLTQGYISGRPSLGFEGQSITVFDQRYYRFPQGVYITDVQSGSDADAKGIRPGDILLQFEDTRITDMDGLNQLLYQHSPGDVIEIVILRGTQQYSLQIALEEAR